MAYTPTTLPNRPQSMPPTMDCRDFVLPNGKYARVILNVEPAPTPDHFILSAQAYEMTSEGQFVMAPNGYPSRTNNTQHTTPVTAIGDTIELDDAWCRFVGVMDPVAEQLTEVTEKPTQPGTTYGQKVWDTVRLHGWIWTCGVACSAVEAKLRDLENVLNTSNIRSGLTFRSTP